MAVFFMNKMKTQLFLPPEGKNKWFGFFNIHVLDFIGNLNKIALYLPLFLGI